MKFLISNHLSTFARSNISRICFCFMLLVVHATMIASPIRSDIDVVDGFINNKAFQQGMEYSDKAHQQYLSQGDSLSAYKLLVKKLYCLKEMKMDNDFVELADKIATDLSPAQYTDQHRQVRGLRCKYLAHKDIGAYYAELESLMAFELEYGNEEKYIDVTLEYVSALHVMGNRDLDISAEVLSRVKDLKKTDYQIFDYNRNLAAITLNVDARKADSIFQVAEKYIDAVPLIKTKAGFLREYGHFLSLNDEYARSIEYGLRALAYYEEQPERFAYTLAGQLTYLSDNFRKIGHLEVARDYQDRALKIGKEKDLFFADAFARSNGDLLEAEGDIDSAQIEFKRALAFSRDRHTGTGIQLYVKYGTTFLKQNNIEGAKQVAKELRNFIAGLENPEDFFEQNFLYARISKKENNLAAVQDYFQQVLNSRLNVGPSYKLEIFKALEHINKRKGNFEEALNFSNEYTSLKGSLDDNIKLQSALTLEAQFHRVQQNNKIALLDSENQLQEVRLSGQRKFIMLISAAFLVFLAISFLLLNLFRKVKSQNLIINKSLEEKDTLLKEIHHRVKNNLQLVSSLLTLQSRDIVDVKAIEAINEGKSRVRSMALIHQDLYSRDNLTGIGMKKYLENLSLELFSTYQYEDQDIQLDLDIDDIYLDVDTIVPIGLIINELITNALKYAFKGRESGILSIAFTELNNTLILDVKDNGKGLDLNNFVKSNSFGNKLISTLTDQLDGSMKVDGDNGTHVHLEFKDYKLAS